MRSILNIIYDLKEFRIRLSNYEDLKTKNRDAAVLALKQIWMDKVDITKGNSSIKAMALGQAGFQTLIDAFLFCKEIKDVDTIDLNDRVKRILRPRILEFNDWLGNSEKELRKRYELEKNYLKSQVNSLKLYARWAKPYLKAAQQLEMKEMPKEPALVKAFNTIILELTLFGKQKIKPVEEALAGNLPKELEKFDRMKNKRDYFFCVLVEFRFRGIPQRIAQQSHYAFGGKAEVSFKSYVLNSDEVKKFQEELDSSETNDVMKLIEGSTGESLETMQDEINFFLEDKEPESEESMDSRDTSNPFTALIGGYEKKTAPAKKPTSEKEGNKNWWPTKESYMEENVLRKFTEEKAEEMAFKLFDVYKKAHGMPSYT